MRCWILSTKLHTKRPDIGVEPNTTLLKASGLIITITRTGLHLSQLCYPPQLGRFRAATFAL